MFRLKAGPRKNAGVEEYNESGNGRAIFKLGANQTDCSYLGTAASLTTNPLAKRLLRKETILTSSLHFTLEFASNARS